MEEQQARIRAPQTLGGDTIKEARSHDVSYIDNNPDKQVVLSARL